MTNNTYQTTSPEMRPEDAARFMTVRYARYGLHKSLLSNPRFAQYLAGVQIVSEQTKTPEVPAVIDYTNEAPADNLQSSDEVVAPNMGLFESSDKLYRTQAAYKNLDKAFENEAA